MNLIEIPESGVLPHGIAMDELLTMVLDVTQANYAKLGFHAPWISYLALKNGQPIGTCAFKTPPINGRAEIAYFTFPGNEGQGIATWMASELIRRCREADASVTIFAQTLPEEGASTSILKKHGFTLIGPVERPEDGTVWEWELRG